MKWDGIYDSMFRSYGPNLFNLVNTLIVAFAINFYQVSIVVKTNQQSSVAIGVCIVMLF
jgi:hypothetical protein